VYHLSIHPILQYVLDNIGHTSSHEVENMISKHKLMVMAYKQMEVLKCENKCGHKLQPRVQKENTRLFATLFSITWANSSFN
jgi:hypothetical protein